MAAASCHELFGGRGRHPVVTVEVRDIQVKHFGYQGADAVGRVIAGSIGVGVDLFWTGSQDV